MTESDPSGQEPQETAPGPGTVRLEDQLCFALYAATNAVTRAYRPDLMALGLTYPQYLMMMVLWQYGRATPSEIARRLGLGLNAVTPVADQLVASGFASRSRSTEDRRKVVIELTPKGAEVERHAARVQQGVVCRTGLEHRCILATSRIPLGIWGEALHALTDEMTGLPGSDTPRREARQRNDRE